MSDFSMDQIVGYFITLTSQEIIKSFDSEEAGEIITSFSQRLEELYEILKGEFNETQLFHSINPIFVIALEESLPGKRGKKDKTIISRHILAVYKTMLEDMVLEPQRRFMSSSKDPWSTFVKSTRTGNQKIYDNEYFNLVEISSTKEEFSFNINRCLYQEVFKRFDREDLGPIMCEYDSIVANNVAQWVRFERAETIAKGFPSCTFRYYNIEQKFSENPVIDNIYSFLQIISDSDEMLTKDDVISQGLDKDTNIEDIMRLYETIRNHSGIKTILIEDEMLFGNVSSYERNEYWKKIFNRKISKEERSKFIRTLPLNLKEEKINRLITDILESPYEVASIKWICLNYLQYHFSARIGFEAKGIDEIQLQVKLDEFSRDYPKISFDTQSIDNTRVSIQAYAKGVPEYKLKEPIRLFRRKMVIDYPDVSISAIQPILSIDTVSQKFFDIFEDSKQPFQLRELALRILISRVGNKLVPFLTKIAENPDDDIFLRGRAIDSLIEFTGDLPNLEKEIHEMPVPIQRAYIDFVKFYGVHEDLLISIASNDNITPVIRMIALKNLTNYIDPQVTEFLLDVIQDKSIDERIRQAALESVGKHEEISKIESTVINVFTDVTESSFLRMEAFETLKELGYNKRIEFANTDWLTLMGMKQLVEE